ncbi:MAG: DUF11 domain-containing protein [Saprospiraceae bacterium]|nr:DUF11 domain-containing protein [Saprospiraceae bacterium]
MRQRLVLILLCFPFLLFSQGWQRYYSGSRAFSLQALPDGSLTLAGNAVDSGGRSDWYWLHADALGQVVAEQKFGDALQQESAQLIVPAGNGWRIYGNKTGIGDSIASVALDAQGQPMGGASMLEGLLYNGRAASDGSVLLAGSAPNGKSLCAKTDPDGQLIWSRSDSLGFFTTGRDVLYAHANGTWLLGDFLSGAPSPNYDFFLLKIDASGQLLDSKTYAWPDDEIPSAIVQQAPDRWIIAGSVRNAANPAYIDEDLMLVAVDAVGDTVWRKHYPLTGYQQLHAAKVLANGNLVLAGETRPEFSGSRNAFLAQVDPIGNLLWYKTYGGIRGDIFWDVVTMPEGGFALAGQTASFGEDTALKTWLVRTDSTGVVWSNRISGQVAFDEVENCQTDAQELSLANWLVAASGAVGTFYGYTDADGRYDVLVDTGIWAVSVLPPSGYWVACADSIPVAMYQLGETTLLDVPVQAAYHCPLMQVDLSTPYLRRCFENTYTVRYQNSGSAIAENVWIAVIPDTHLTPIGSNLPYVLAGDTLLFELGPVAPMQGGSFVLTALLDCENTVPGQTHCSEAFILPDSLCYAISPDWDGAMLEVSGLCAGDSVVLHVANTGAGMQNPVAYVITEDQVIFRQAQLFLGAGQDTTFVLYPGGATVTLMVQQTAGFPGNSTPTLVIEGCGGFPFSTGYALQFPTDDGDPFHDLECRENIGSFDPNDKTGLPAGVTEAGYLAAGSAIEYLIRFQNTGTDTAFRVEIRDTLPPGLDLATLEQGAASHAYRLEISGSGALRFVFDPIALPDSFANPVASQGFVKYRINTHKGLEDGTRLENRAAIYFDFNAPVLTEYTLHTIGDPLAYLLVDVVEPNLPGTAVSSLKATPNPFRESTLLEWPEGKGGGPYRVQIWDNQGRLIRETECREAAFQLEMDELKENMFLIRVSHSGETIAVGRVVRH